MRNLAFVPVILVAYSLVVVALARLLKRVSPPEVFPAEEIAGSPPDVLRVGSAALVTMDAGVNANGAREAIARCEDMIFDGVVHLVLEFEGPEVLSDAAVAFLLRLSELETTHRGRLCVVCADEADFNRLDRAGVTGLVSVLGHRRPQRPSPTLVTRSPRLRPTKTPRRLFERLSGRP